eukprot:15437174-Alexandrium_andersonii.AAC.1
MLTTVATRDDAGMGWWVSRLGRRPAVFAGRCLSREGSYPSQGSATSLARRFAMAVAVKHAQMLHAM